MHGSSLGKQAITHRSRKLHFLSWCHDVGLPDPCTPELPLQGRNWIIACYTVSLIRGNTITGIRIRHATLQGYVSQALSLHIDRGLTSPSLADINYIKIMTNAVNKYKTVPNHKEMISDSMFNYTHPTTHLSTQSSTGSPSAATQGSGNRSGAPTTPSPSPSSTTPTGETARRRCPSLPAISSSLQKQDDDYTIRRHRPITTSKSLHSASRSKRTTTTAKPSRTAAVQIPTGCAPYRPASTSHDTHGA
jgi:hypothetical protein